MKKNSTILLMISILIISILCGSIQAQVSYCPASGGCDEYISNVSVGSINNPSPCGNYQDFTSLSTVMLPGSSHTITITNGNPSYPDDQCGIWVDWNQNGNFLDDPPIIVGGTPGIGPYTAIITVPFTAIPGTTRLRVRILYTGNIDPCGVTTYGEVEDYTIIVPSLNPVDAGIQSINEPISPNSPGIQDVKASIINYGTQALTSVNIGWSVDGVVGTPYVWTGNLASLATTGPITIGNTNLGLGTHTIKVWTSNPNNIPDPFLLNDTMQISVITCNLLNGTYTVGDAASDYPTIAAAINAASACGIAGPVNFLIQNGTYNEQVILPPIPGTSQTNYVSISSALGNPTDVTISYAAASDLDNYTIKLDGADYISISGLTIQANGSTYARAIVLANSADHNIIQGNVIACNPNAVTFYTSAGIYSEYSVDQGNFIIGNTITHACNGVYLNGDWGNPEANNLVEGNTIQGFYNAGIYAYMQSSFTAKHNDLHGGPFNTWMNGLYVDNCQHTLQITSNRVILQGPGSYTGMNLDYLDNVDTLRGLIANNFISVQSTNNSADGISMYNGNHVDLVYNSVRSQSPSSYSNAFYYSSWSGINNNILNNIFSTFGSGYAVNMDFGATSTIQSMNHNDLFSTGQYLAYYSMDLINLAGWVQQTGLDSNSVSANPGFSTSTSLYPSSASINNMGTPFAGVFDDIDGNLRDFVSPDIGAVEFTPPATDMALIAWLSPTPSACGLSSSEPVTVQVYNNGVNPQTGYSVRYSFDGGQTFSIPEVITTQLNSGDTLTYTFSQTANMIAVGSYSCMALVSQPGDQNVLNDTMKGIHVVNLGTISSFPFIENFDSGNTHYFATQSAPNSSISVSPISGNPSYSLAMTGGFNSNWSGWSTSTSPYEAWEINTWHHSSAISCDINATGISNLKLSLDLRMTYSYGPMYSYFRVLINDTAQLADVNGQSNFNPLTQDSDPFNTIDFDLSPYAGSYFTLTLQAAMNYAAGSGAGLGDHAFVDNIKLYVPVPNDVGMGAILSPSDSACAGAITPVSVILKNYGTATQTTCPIHVLVTNPDNTTQSLSYSYIGSLPANAKDTLMIGYINTQQPGIYIIRALTALVGDQASYNDTLIRSFISISPIDSFPYVEDFESFTYVPYNQGIFANGWTASKNSAWGFQMEVGQGSTPSSYTGPMGDHTTGNGLYVFSEASNGDFGDEAMLISPCLDLSSISAPELKFWYHMYGASIGSLHLDILQGGVWHNGIHSLTGQQQSSSSDSWLEATISLSAYPAIDKIRFRVVRDWSFEGDVCIDDVMIRQAPAKEAHLLSMATPMGRCDLGLEAVSVSIWNRGADTINGNCSVFYQVQGGAGFISEPMTSIIFPGDTGSFTFQTPINLSVTSDSIFTIKTWVSLLGDTWNQNDTSITKVFSNVSPAPPQVNNVTVIQGYPATLAIINPDTAQSYFWYDSLSSIIPLGTGTTYLTPPVNTTSIFWVDAMYGSGFQTITIGPGLSTTPYVPTYGYYDYSWSGSIYTALEINAKGSIDSIGYYIDNPVGYPMNNQKIWFKHTSDSVFPSTNKPDPTSMSKVFEGTINWTGPGWFSIPLDTSFKYNGLDHLMVYWENHDGSFAIDYPYFRTSPTTDYRALFDYQDVSFPTFPGILTYERADIHLSGSGNGCPSMRIPDTVFVIAPVVIADAGPDLTICQGDTVQLIVNALGGVQPYSYNWSPTGSISSATIHNPLAFPLLNTTYSVTVSDQNADYGTDDVIITVKPSPNVSLTGFPNVTILNPPLQLLGGSPLGGTYSGPGVSGGYFYAAVAGGGTHTITYSYASPSSGCIGSASATIYVDPNPGIDVILTNPGITIFPNPSPGIITIDVDSHDSEMLLKIIDNQGKVIIEQNLVNIHTPQEIDLRTLVRGVYQVRLTGEKDIFIQKLILCK